MQTFTIMSVRKKKARIFFRCEKKKIFICFCFQFSWNKGRSKDKSCFLMHHQAGQQKEKTFLVGEAIVEKVKKKSYCFQNKGGFLFFAALHKRETLHFEIWNLQKSPGTKQIDCDQQSRGKHTSCPAGVRF